MTTRQLLSLQARLMMASLAMASSGCGATATINVRAGGQGSSARAEVRGGSTFFGAVASLLEQSGDLTQASFVTEGRGAPGSIEVTADHPSTRGLAAIPDFGGAEVPRGGEGVSWESYVNAERAGAVAIAGGVERPRTPLGVGGGGASSRPPRGAGSAVDTSRRGTVAAGSRLIDLVGGGVLVDGERVLIGDLGPLSSFGLGGGYRASSEEELEWIVDQGPVRSFAEIASGQLTSEGGEVEVVVGLRGVATGAPRRGTNRVHLVIDRSESMAAIWSEVVAAARGLIGALDPGDMIHLVSYGSSAVEVVPPSPVGDGRSAIEALSELEVGGYTNLEAGLEMAYQAVRRAGVPQAGDTVLVLLVSDGVPNVGAFGPTEVGRLAAEARVELGCTTAAIGLGLDFDGAVLQAVSREGRGGYHVAQTAAELLPVLTSEVGARERVAAQAVELSFDLAPGARVIEVRDGQAGVVLTDGGLSLGLPRVYVGEERQLTVRLQVGPGVGRRALLEAQLSLGLGTSRRVHHGRLSLEGAAAPASQRAELALADSSLSEALAGAGAALRLDDGERAAEALRAHARSLRASGRLTPPLSQRTRRVELLATALGALGTGAPSEDRTIVARQLGALALTMGR